MSQSSSSCSFSSSSSAKLGYNKHFPRSFLLNYGAALQDPKEEAILKRVHDFNCEWLQRPNIAISELAQTLRENLPLLQQYSGTIFMPEFVQDLASRLEPLKGVLDNKDKSTSQPASREDVVSLLRTIDGDPEVEDFAVQGLNAAGPLFMVCIHLLVPLTLMRHPEEFAEKARRTSQNASFKEDPSPRQMRDFILNSITKRRRPTSAGSIWDCLDDQDEEQGEPGPSPRRPAHARRRSQSSTPLPSLWEDQEPTVLDNEAQRQVRSSRSPHVSRKRRYSSTPPSSQEVFTQRDLLPGPAPSKWKRRRQPATSTPIARPKPAKRTASSSSSSSGSSDLSSSSDEEPAQEKQAQKPALKAMQSKGKTAAQAAAAKTQLAAKTKVSTSKAQAKKVSSSSSDSSDSSSDQAPPAKKSTKKTAASTASTSSSAKASTTSKVPDDKTTQSSSGPKAKPKAKAKAKD